jgi:hypothetical protein
MSEITGKRDVWVDGNLYIENFSRIPLEELVKYAGKFVAVTRDGARILVADDEEERLPDRLQAAGIDISDVVIDYIDPQVADSSPP